MLELSFFINPPSFLGTGEYTGIIFANSNRLIKYYLQYFEPFYSYLLVNGCRHDKDGVQVLESMIVPKPIPKIMLEKFHKKRKKCPILTTLSPYFK